MLARGDDCDKGEDKFHPGPFSQCWRGSPYADFSSKGRPSFLQYATIRLSILFCLIGDVLTMVALVLG